MTWIDDEPTPGATMSDRRAWAEPDSVPFWDDWPHNPDPLFDLVLSRASDLFPAYTREARVQHAIEQLRHELWIMLVDVKRYRKQRRRRNA